MRSMASASTASLVPSSAARSRFLVSRTVVRVRVRRDHGRGTHCAVARHLRYVGSPVTQGRSPAVAARGTSGSCAAIRPPSWRRRILRVSSSASSQDWPVVRAATVAPRTANGRSSTATATSWRLAVRLAPAAAGTEDSLAQAGLSPVSPRIRAPAMTLPPSGGLTGDAVASKDRARWPESSSHRRT